MKISLRAGFTVGSAALLLLLSGASTASAHPGLDLSQKGEPCPYLENQKHEEMLEQIGQGYKQAPMRSLAQDGEGGGDGGIPEGGFAAVENDLIELMTTSNPDWPADFGSYAGLMIRLAWHCAGSYRESDGRGGCDGGRIRVEPEASWEDNANLDMARMLLAPTKEKYGSALSWGDLIQLAGVAAIKSAGGPILGFCGGRIDDADGSDSLNVTFTTILGPSDEQEAIGPCQSIGMQGDCLSVEGTALGPTTVGLIYVNPGGPVTAPNDPVASGEDIRRAFGRMGFDDQTSAILIGAGHALGKAHGACPDPPCGNFTGGENTFTSGFEGAWTTTPTTWSNQYFNNLLDFTWEIVEGSGGGMQWTPFFEDGSPGPDIFMLTTDIALRDDELYFPFVEYYAGNMTAHDADFAAAWYRLTSADMGPATRCIGDDVPEPQPWQYTLPASPDVLPDYIPVRAAIQEHFDAQAVDEAHVAGFISLAYACASTFRFTDYRGGCNGARIRFPPESEWESNAVLVEQVNHLEGIKEVNDFDVSMADMIVLAGITALENANPSLDLPFCGGYVDDTNADGSEPLAPRFYDDPYVTVTDDFLVKGLSLEQGVALASKVSVGSQWYQDLLAVNGTTDNFTIYELALLEGDLLPIVEMFASDEASLIEYFESGWTYMMTADRFLDNRKNACTGVDTATLKGETPAPVAPVAPTPTAPVAPAPTSPGAPDAPTSGVLAWTTVSGAAAGLLVALGLF